MTGASGFVGGVLARQLAERGHQVVALVRDPDRATALRNRGAQLVPGDLSDTSALSTLCDGVDGLFHVAGWYKLGVPNRAEAIRVNVEGTRAVLAAARAAGVPRVVYTSTLAVNSDTGATAVDETYRFAGRHLSAYDQTKADAHDVAVAAAADGLDVVTVMPGVVYGPGDTSETGRLLVAVISGRRPLVPSAGAVCWAYVDDVAAGHRLAMDRGASGESYMLAGTPASLAEALRMAAKITRTPGPIVIPGAAVRGTAALAGVVNRFVRLPPTYHPETLRASLASYLGRPDKAIKDLGWSARSLREGLDDLIARTKT